MVRRHRDRPQIGEPERGDILRLAGDLRRGLLRPLLKHGCPDRVAADRLKDAIDDFAGAITGDREHFWTKAARSADYPGQIMPTTAADRPESPKP